MTAKQRPAWLDMTTTDGQTGRSYTSKGIYQIDGDILKMAWTLDDEVRPQCSVIKADDSLRVLTFKRVLK